MAQIVITDTFAVDRDTMWNIVADLDAWTACEDITLQRLDGKNGKGARRRITIAGHDMVDEVLERTKGEQITFGAVEFHNAPFKHFVTTFRLAGDAQGPTSVAIAIDFAGGLAGLAQKGRIQRVFQRLLKELGHRAAQEPETIQVTA